MNLIRNTFAAVCTASCLALLPALAGANADSQGFIDITHPKNGAVLSKGGGIKLKYNDRLGPNGNHLHVYVDGGRPIIDHHVHNCPCSITLPDLSPGLHTVKVVEATAQHHLLPLSKSVQFTVKK